MKIRYGVLLSGLILPFVLACKQDPTGRLVNPLQDGAVSNQSGVFMLYDEELKTGGGLAFIPGGENQSINLADKNAYEGLHDLVYSWNGGDVTNFNETPPVQQHLFAGFQFLVAQDAASNPAARAKDFSSFGYTKLVFQIRGSLSQDTILRVEGPNGASGTANSRDFTASQLPSSWQEFEVAITPSKFGDVKTFFTVTFQYTQTPRFPDGGNGGVVYFDNIRYAQ